MNELDTYGLKNEEGKIILRFRLKATAVIEKIKLEGKNKKGLKVVRLKPKRRI